MLLTRTRATTARHRPGVVRAIQAELSAVLHELVVAHFEPVATEAFEVFLERGRDAERAGYPVLA
jgi:hypothetical protein